MLSLLCEMLNQASSNKIWTLSKICENQNSGKQKVVGKLRYNQEVSVLRRWHLAHSRVLKLFNKYSLVDNNHLIRHTLRKMLLTKTPKVETIMAIMMQYQDSEKLKMILRMRLRTKYLRLKWSHSKSDLFRNSNQGQELLCKDRTSSPVSQASLEVHLELEEVHLESEVGWGGQRNWRLQLKLRTHLLIIRHPMVSMVVESRGQKCRAA